MGEVYRATDTNLDRQVAIKILPDLFAHDPDRLARFEREAKTLASRAGDLLDANARRRAAAHRSRSGTPQFASASSDREA
jgi:hypothetical protein